MQHSILLPIGLIAALLAIDLWWHSGETSTFSEVGTGFVLVVAFSKWERGAR